MNRSTDRRRSRQGFGSRALATALITALLGACGTVPERPMPSQTEDTAAAEPDKGDPRARFSSAMDLWKQNQISEAETAFTELVQDFPDYAGPWTNLGILYAKSNRRDRAIGALTKAASLNPQNKTAFNWLGILHRESGDLNRALQSYQQALAIDPEYALAHYNLGILYDAHFKRPADALPHYRDYLRLAKTEDLKVMAWIAEIEARQPAPAPVAPSTDAAP